MGKILAIDFGLKRTGIAITDASNIIASPLTTVDSIQLMTFLIDIVKKENVTTIVMGDPKRLNNEATHITENVYLLKEALEKQFPSVKIELMDERFTSKMALQSMIDGGMKKKQRQEKGMIDQISAAIILQSYLAQF
ncbi:MAG: Holliday junction resolvase RuvX [Crocinitomicaceae bacterium]|nr:Holliday junction resolvase RuvX [Crocinitomicaceae bacterium]